MSQQSSQTAYVSSAFDGLRWIACLFGYPLVIYGWFHFAINVSVLVFTPYAGLGDDFRSLSYFLIPGWLLLRLGAGLFPFGKRLFPG